MQVVELLSEASRWLRDAERWNIITLVICLAALTYVVARMVLRAREERAAAHAMVSDSLRIAARRYHESAWS